ncbi:hypothetical protein TrST_g277 [Triparma strigata]|uniref:Major facilitator superfamily (MFS) profile domain-containing protein n=1 Tax=Triparma strigata TaxID=1606541 RepID=A0A9W7A816_9STRA|nr:hypothetical protein TrST_g277 [Triparma strigata]
MGICSTGVLSSPVFEKTEAWGYLWVLLIRGVGWTTWVFLQVAILKYSNNSVGCSTKGYEMLWNATMNRTQTEDEANVFEIDCTGEVSFMGKMMTPSTAIPFTTSIGVLAVALISPIFGAVIDRTSKRKLWTFVSLGVFIFVNALQIFTTPDNWVLMLALQNFLARLGFALHVACVAAYCTEIAEGEQEIIALQSAGRIAETGAMVGTLFTTIIGSTVMGFGKDVGSTATFSQAFATVISIPIFFYAMVRFEERPALNKTEGSIFTAGFKQLFNTGYLLYKENTYVLQYLFGLAFCDGGNSNVFVLFPIYAMLQNGLENPAVFTGLAMIVCIPGALLTKKIATKIGIRRQLGNILFSNSVICALLAGAIYQDGNFLGVLLVALGFGLTIGGTYPMQKGMYMRLIPAGQEVEYQGLYNFFSLLLQTLPLTWFVYCEDENVGGENSMRIGMLGLVLFFFIAFLLMSLFMNEQAAVAKVEATLYKRVRGTGIVGTGKQVAPI